jgi:hypothetical protein
VIFVPNFARNDAISSPMMPPPITTIDFGIVFSSRASFDEIIASPSNLAKGRSTARAPVATMTARVVRSFTPSFVLTRTRPAETTVASPIRASAPLPLSNCATPPVSFATTVPFHACSFSTSSVTPPERMPSSSLWPAASKTCAAWMSALEGMQP